MSVFVVDANRKRVSINCKHVCFTEQLESTIGHCLWEDVNTFESNDTNSSITYRINKLQSTVSLCVCTYVCV